MKPKIDDVPHLLMDSLPNRAGQIEQIVEENTTDSEQVLFYPILSRVLNAVIEDEEESEFSDRTE
jgi:hypothetical protein